MITANTKIVMCESPPPPQRSVEDVSRLMEWMTQDEDEEINTDAAYYQDEISLGVSYALRVCFLENPHCFRTTSFFVVPLKKAYKYGMSMQFRKGRTVYSVWPNRLSLDFHLLKGSENHRISPFKNAATVSSGNLSEKMPDPLKMVERIVELRVTDDGKQMGKVHWKDAFCPPTWVPITGMLLPFVPDGPSPGDSFALSSKSSKARDKNRKSRKSLKNPSSGKPNKATATATNVNRRIETSPVASSSNWQSGELTKSSATAAAPAISTVKDVEQFEPQSHAINFAGNITAENNQPNVNRSVEPSSVSSSSNRRTGELTKSSATATARAINVSDNVTAEDNQPKYNTHDSDSDVKVLSDSDVKLLSLSTRKRKKRQRSLTSISPEKPTKRSREVLDREFAIALQAGLPMTTRSRALAVPLLMPEEQVGKTSAVKSKAQINREWWNNDPWWLRH